MAVKHRGRLLAVKQIVVGNQPTNYTTIDELGNIAQSGAASAALGDVTTGSIRFGSTGTEMQHLKFGSISPCFNEIAACTTGTGSVAITGLTTTHYVFVSPSSPVSPCCILTAVSPLAGVLKIGLYNEGNTAAVCTTCPWAYLAIK